MGQRGVQCLLPPGGGLRERPEGLLQEADRSAEQPNHPALGLALQGGQAEGGDREGGV